MGLKRTTGPARRWAGYPLSELQPAAGRLRPRAAMLAHAMRDEIASLYDGLELDGEYSRRRSG